MNPPTKNQKQTHVPRKQTYGCQRGGRVGEEWIEGLGLADVNYHIQNG